MHVYSVSSPKVFRQFIILVEKQKNHLNYKTLFYKLHTAIKTGTPYTAQSQVWTQVPWGEISVSPVKLPLTKKMFIKLNIYRV